MNFNIIDIIKFIISQPICSGIAGTLLGIILTHFLYNSKLKKEQKIKIIGYISKQRIECINEIQKVLNKLKKYERVDMVHPKSEIDGNYSYPVIFTNYETFNTFYKEYQYMVDNYSDFLNKKCLKDLYVGMNYIQELLLVSSILFSEDELYMLGAFLYPEINKWVMKFKDNLNMLLNNPPFKYSKRTGLRYLLSLKLVSFKVNHSMLHKNFIKNTELGEKDLKNIFSRLDGETELESELETELIS